MATKTKNLERLGQRWPAVVRLRDGWALEPGIVGAKAAALARAARTGMPVLPGAVLTVGSAARGAETALLAVWEELSQGGRRALAVRSSSTAEDGATSSMAGQFTSVLDVDSWVGLLAAIEAVRASAHGHPMAVLLQPMLDAVSGGVLFGVDPVSGRSDHLLVEVVAGGPAALVSGQATAVRHVLTHRGRVLASDDGRWRCSLRRHDRRQLAAASRHLADTFGSPQDVEWAFDASGSLWVLQSRPVTAQAAAGPARGPLFGPGPVAETLPGALTPLEQDLWVEPLHLGIRGALGVLGVVPRRVLRRRDLVVVVGGRVAADLALLGAASPSGFLRRLDPRPPARRLAAAWRVGRLRGAMPLLAADVTARVDAELAAVPDLRALDGGRLLDVLHASRDVLQAVHGHEVLAGMLGAEEGAGAAGQALLALHEGRRAGRTDAQIVADSPVVLSLTAPAVGRRPELPPDAPAPVAPGALSPREALRLRSRWVQELGARVAAELGGRLHAEACLSAPGLVRWLTLAELEACVDGAPPPADLTQRATVSPAAPLPATFRLAPDGRPLAVGGAPEGRGVGGGRASGRVHHGLGGMPAPGSVLVVDTLDPALAGWLPTVAAVVAETGSVLSHLAILAREVGVPAVVGVGDARRRFPEGATVLVDGTTGEVTVLDPEGVR